MKSLRFLPLLLLPLFLASCGTLSHDDRRILQAHDVSPNVYDKMLDGEPLSLEDVIELSQRAVPPGLIIRYMEDIDTAYILRKADVRKLRSAGVSEEVIAYMLSTAPQYGPGPYPGPYGGPYASPYGPYGPYPYGYYGYGYGYYGPAIFIGGYGWGHGGWDHGGWGHGGWGHGGWGGHGHGHH